MPRKPEADDKNDPAVAIAADATAAGIEVLKKPDRSAKGKGARREARLAAALRDNLRRRKAAQRKDKD